MLTWSDCIREAIKNHPDLISASEKLKQSKADKSITMSTMLPQISADASDKKMETDAKKEYEASSYGITGRQLLFDGFKTASDAKAASKTISASQYNYAVTSSNIRLRLRTAFTELLRTQKLILMTEEIALRRKQNSELV
ncbi:TolC family protein, partial [bacterium]|nr:TolC family protein [bacterium]